MEGEVGLCSGRLIEWDLMSVPVRDSKFTEYAACRTKVDLTSREGS